MLVHTYPEGEALGICDGVELGATDSLGCDEGSSLGVWLGTWLGWWLGREDGCWLWLGWWDGTLLGRDVTLGDAEGAGTPPRLEGFLVGARRLVGTLVVAGVQITFFITIASLRRIPFLVLQLTPPIRCRFVTRPR